MTATHRLAENENGSMAIETAIIAPILILLALGTADVSRMISRQNELQAGLGQIEAIALAANASSSTDTNALKSVLMQSLGLTSAQVSVVKQYRCNADQALVSATTSCSSTDVVSSYVRISLSDSYNPFWQRISGIGTWNFSVVRTVQLS